MCRGRSKGMVALVWEGLGRGRVGVEVRIG